MITPPQAAVTVPAPAPTAEPAAIKPIAGLGYRLVTEDVRDNGTLRRRFVQTTELVFRPERGGWAVESTLVDARAEPAGDDASARFLLSAKPLRARTVRVHLDALGRIIAVDDEEAAWSAFLAGVDAMADRRPGQALPLAHDPTIAFRSLPPDARRALIASAVRTAVPLRPRLGTRPVTLPAIAFGDTPLLGSETVSEADGMIRDDIRGSRVGSDGAQSLERDRRLDAATGLLDVAVETRTVRINDRIRTSQRTDRLLPVP